MSAECRGSVARILPGSRYQLTGIDADGVDGVALEVAPVEASDRRVVLFIETPRTGGLSIFSGRPTSEQKPPTSCGQKLSFRRTWLDHWNAAACDPATR